MGKDKISKIFSTFSECVAILYGFIKKSCFQHNDICENCSSSKHEPIFFVFLECLDNFEDHSIQNGPEQKVIVLKKNLMR
jgi:hypothetical protein